MDPVTIGLIIAAVGKLASILGKDIDYPTAYSSVRLKNGVATANTDWAHALDTGKKEDAKLIATTAADYINAVIAGLGLTEEQKKGLTTPGITVGVISHGRPGNVSKGGFFFGDQDGGEGFLSGIQSKNQGFQTPEEALTAMSRWMLKEAIKPEVSDFNALVNDNPELLEEYEDYKYDRKDEGRGWMSKAAWAKSRYEQGRLEVPPNPNLDPTAVQVIQESVPKINAQNLGLNIVIPQTYSDSNFWTKAGMGLQIVGAAVAGYGAITNMAAAGAEAGAAAAEAGGSMAAQYSPVAAPIDAALAQATGTAVGNATAAGGLVAHSPVVTGVDAALTATTGVATGTATGMTVANTMKPAAKLAGLLDKAGDALEIADNAKSAYDMVAGPGKAPAGIINADPGQAQEPPKDYSTGGVRPAVGPSGATLRNMQGVEVYTPQGLLNREAFNY